ncbi:mechanosensitive ion channel family protein [Natronolimnobius sp. AArcel1]|uniref:mechanosensitive ion channel family protein n=1 Tax=Natronolimnobius sp. AArcel1 TaxID=1679093 RepID=UPI0013EAC1F4|nr:mechanosensitive ion channel family protein [Natronolimnobius sp. AArcel1]
MHPLLVEGLRTAVTDNIVGLIEFLPTLIGVAVLVYLGLLFGEKLKPVVTDAGRRVELDDKVRQTPFEALFPDDEDGVSRAFGILVKYYVAAIALFVAIEWFLTRTAATNWYMTDYFQELLGYVPPIIIGTVVLFVGFYVANWATAEVRDSVLADRFDISPLMAGTTKAFLYFVVLVIGLDTMGVDVTILHTFAQAFAYAVGLALALAVGIAFGWGGKDYVAENIDSWFQPSENAADDTTATVSDD